MPTCHCQTKGAGRCPCQQHHHRRSTAAGLQATQVTSLAMAEEEAACLLPHSTGWAVRTTRPARPGLTRTRVAPSQAPTSIPMAANCACLHVTFAFTLCRSSSVPHAGPVLEGPTVWHFPSLVKHQQVPRNVLRREPQHHCKATRTWHHPPVAALNKEVPHASARLVHAAGVLINGGGKHLHRQAKAQP